MKAFIVHTRSYRPFESSLWYSPDVSDFKTKGTWISVADGFIARNNAWNDSFDLFLTGLLVEWSDGG